MNNERIKGIAIILKRPLTRKKYQILSSLDGFQGYETDGINALLAVENRNYLFEFLNKLEELNIKIETFEDITKEGHWDQSEDDPSFFYCSECHKIEMGQLDYCLNCFSKMTKPETYEVNYNDWTAVQSNYDYHVWVYKNKKHRMHAQVTKPLSEEELLDYLKNAIEFIEVNLPEMQKKLAEDKAAAEEEDDI